MQEVEAMELITIGEVSSALQISARMLRYYEKAGLIQSTHRDGYAYRMYDADTVQKIQQILLLRKLQIPLKHIRCILYGTREEAICILEARLREMRENAKTVQAMKTAVECLLRLLREDTAGKPAAALVQEPPIVEAIQFLPLEKHHLKERLTMSNKEGLVEKSACVRIVLLPPCTVASYQFTGDSPEEAVGAVMNTFVRSSRLYEKKPDARLFGFNHPDMEPGSDFHGYEDWVTIPDDMEVPAPLVKKHFPGGLYAAYTIHFPDFHEWNFLRDWVNNSENWEADYHDAALKDMGGCLEDHLNWVYAAHLDWPDNGVHGQCDLLLPIKERKK